MLYPQKKERENRFKLALRMGLPIFILGILLTFINSSHLTSSFYISSIFLLGLMIYFFLYMIYTGFDERTTDLVTHTFTREYIYKLLKKEIIKRDYSIILISIDNLNTINTRYGLKNGDLVLYETILKIDNILSSKKIKNYPIGHLKGGDFLIGLDGKQKNYNKIFEIVSVKLSDFKVKDIEVKVNISILDNKFSKNIDYIIDRLFQLQKLNKSSKDIVKNNDIIDQEDLEKSIIESVKRNDFLIFSQAVFNKQNEVVMYDLSIRLKIDNKTIFQKTYMSVINRLNLSYEYDTTLLSQIALKLSNNSSKYCFNISPTTLRDSRFIPFFKNIFLTYPNIKKRIILLIYEIDFYTNVKYFNKIIQNIRAIGALVVIDRLCEYHSSFLYLREIAVDMVRFDSKYSKKLNQYSYKAILKGVKLITDELNIITWIKMIENEETFKQIKDINIDIFQGRYLEGMKEI